MVHYVLESGLPIIYDEFERLLIKVTFDEEMIRYTDLEMAHITKSLSGSSIFNLTDKPLNKEIMDWINHRAKYNPYVRQPIHMTLQKFDDSFVACTNKIFKQSFCQTKVLSGRSSIHCDLNALKRSKPGSSQLISSLQSIYMAKGSQLKHKLLHCQC